MSFTAQSLFLPNWFVRRRGLAISIAFSGVGVGAILLLPWLQSIIVHNGWRASCWAMGLLVFGVLGPLNLFVWRRPEDIGLLPDGASRVVGAAEKRDASNVVDPAWASIEWTLARADPHRPLLVDCRRLFLWARRMVCRASAPDEVPHRGWVHSARGSLGTWHRECRCHSWSDRPRGVVGPDRPRIDREWVWTAGCAGFGVCYAALIALQHSPAKLLLYLMVISQGFLGYALASVMGAIVVEIFEGPHYGSIFGTFTVALIGGGAAGPWVAGVIHDATGSYRLAFILAIGCCIISAAAIWIAAPRKVRMVPSRRAST
jgi:MFS family permease